MRSASTLKIRRPSHWNGAYEEEVRVPNGTILSNGVFS